MIRAFDLALAGKRPNNPDQASGMSRRIDEQQCAKLTFLCFKRHSGYL